MSFVKGAMKVVGIAAASTVGAVTAVLATVGACSLYVMAVDPKGMRGITYLIEDAQK